MEIIATFPGWHVATRLAEVGLLPHGRKATYALAVKATPLLEATTEHGLDEFN